MPRGLQTQPVGQSQWVRRVIVLRSRGRNVAYQDFLNFISSDLPVRLVYMETSAVPSSCLKLGLFHVTVDCLRCF